MGIELLRCLRVLAFFCFGVCIGGGVAGAFALSVIVCFLGRLTALLNYDTKDLSSCNHINLERLVWIARSQLHTWYSA